MAIKETRTSQAVTMEAHRQALIEIALKNEHLVNFLSQIEELLFNIGREDVEVIVKSHLERHGVAISVSIIYDSLYPGLELEDPPRNMKIRQAEVELFEALKQAKIKIVAGFVIGESQIMKTHLVIFKGKVYYQGVFSEEK